MSQHASGPMYRPSHNDDEGMDPGTRRLLYLAGFGGLAILVGIAAYSLTGRSSGDAVPVVQADSRPMKVRPENPGGMTVAPQEKPVDPANSRLAPGTEEPNPQALLAMQSPLRNPLLPAPPAPPRSKAFTVQLSSAKSEADAQAAWDKLAKKMPDLLGQHRALFQKTSETGPASWRLRTSGFADQAQAKAFCDRVKAKGGQCSVVES
jgi:hypothetical protein